MSYPIPTSGITYYTAISHSQGQLSGRLPSGALDKPMSAARSAAAQLPVQCRMLHAYRGGLRPGGVEGSIRSSFHGPDGPQTQQIVVSGNQRQIHDLSRSSEKPIG